LKLNRAVILGLVPRIQDLRASGWKRRAPQPSDADSVFMDPRDKPEDDVIQINSMI